MYSMPTTDIGPKKFVYYYMNVPSSIAAKNYLIYGKIFTFGVVTSFLNVFVQ